MPRQELSDEQQAVLLGLYRIIQEKASVLTATRPPLDRVLANIVAAAQRCKALGLR